MYLLYLQTSAKLHWLSGMSCNWEEEMEKRLTESSKPRIIPKHVMTERWWIYLTCLFLIHSVNKQITLTMKIKKVDQHKMYKKKKNYLKLFIVTLVLAESQIMRQLQRTRKNHYWIAISRLGYTTSSIRS